MKLIASIVVVAFVLLAFFAGGFFSPNKTVIYNTNGAVNYVSPAINGTGRSAMVILPAVDDNGTGVATQLIVQLLPGTGRVLVNIDRLIFWTDTQDSIRIAEEVAVGYTRENASMYDFIYTIKANASVIQGPSAGGALAVATIAALRGVQPNASVMMTGTISPDGRIGPIGEAMAKAKAAKDIGAELFIVPEGQSVDVNYQQVQRCSKFGARDICRNESVAVRTDIGDATGIRVVEATTIGDALRYFLGEGV